MCVEALTMALDTAQGAAANHLGPLSMYLDAGFQVVRETDDGDVFVRKSLVAAQLER